ncbi:MAG: helix-turn-helix domain-containing protein [Gemmatimonadota bacterium]
MAGSLTRVPFLKPPQTKLTEEDWLAEALQTLAAEGVSAVRVERLARSLGVTKGSFYWHFKSHGELLARLRDYWASHHTVVVDAYETQGPAEAETMLLALLRRIILEDANRYDAAVRAWGLFDSLTAEAVLRVDETRLAFVKELFLRMGFDREEAEFRSRMSYYYVIGETSAGIDRTSEDRLAFLDRRHRRLVDRTPIR